MRRTILAVLMFCCPTLVFADVFGKNVVIQEEDGSPKGVVRTLKVTDDKLVQNAPGEFSLSIITGAPIDAEFWVGAPNATLTAEHDLSGFTGLVLNTAGTPSAYAGTSCSNQFVRSLDASASATCNTVSLTADITGTLAVGNGGTGATSLTEGGVLFGGGSGAITAGAVMTSGQLLIGDGTTAPTLATLTGTALEIDITNGAGSIIVGLVDPLAVSKGGTGATTLADLIALTTDTTGNYVGSVATTSPLTGGAAGSEGATLTLAITDDGIQGTELADSIIVDGTSLCYGDGTNKACIDPDGDLSFDGTADYLVCTNCAAFKAESAPNAQLLFDGVNTSMTFRTTTSTDALRVTASASGTTVATRPIQLGENGTDGQLLIYSEQGTTDFTNTFSPHAAMTQNVAYTLPPDDGDANERLITNGSGAQSWEGEPFDWTLKPVQAKLPTADFGKIDPGTNSSRIIFDDTTPQCVQWEDYLHPYNGGALEARIQYSMQSATSGTLEWEVSLMCVTPGDAVDVDTESFDTINTGTETVPATAGFLSEITVTLTNADSCAQGDRIKCKLCRDADDGTNDTATGNAEFRTGMVCEAC